jgi:hypothetical protein
MTMIDQRDIKSLSTDEITNYLCEAGFGGYLTKSEYLEIMEELEARALQPEVLADLATFGKPEWYKHKFGFDS